MLITTAQLLQQARKGGYAVGAFNIYHLSGVQAVIGAAQELESPVILQLLPKAVELGGTPLIALCLEAGRSASVPVAVHLDHCASEKTIRAALAAGISSVMADGSHLPYDENLAFTRKMTDLARSQGRSVEAELGRLSGTEDGLTVAAYQARLTDPDQAADFVEKTGIDALAVCIGNVHGTYPGQPNLDFGRLEAIRKRVSIPLVLHGTSGLPDEMIKRSIELGVSKFNINTELRTACVEAAQAYLNGTGNPELVGLMGAEVEAMKAPVNVKMKLFGSEEKAF